MSREYSSFDPTQKPEGYNSESEPKKNKQELPRLHGKKQPGQLHRPTHQSSIDRRQSAENLRRYKKIKRSQEGPPPPQEKQRGGAKNWQEYLKDENDE